jgi:squalene-associated FAD-dependent desaturase
MIERFWHPVLVSALSESLDRIDVRHARKVFVDGFLNSRDGWKLHVPNVPLSTIYDGMQQRLESLGVTFRMESRVAEIIGSYGATPRALRLATGETLSASHIVLAVPCWHVADVLPAAWRDAPEVKALNQIETAPITSVHLWYDMPITELPHCVLTNRVSQWLFRKNSDREQIYQVVISNSRDLLNRPASEIATIVEQELRDTFPATREARLLRSKVITERRAVFSPTPGIDALRPAQRTPWPSIYWCGDWTATGWPSTMESAVRSGVMAAAGVLQSEH